MFFGTMGITLLSNIDILGIKFISESVVSSELTGYYQGTLMLARVPLLVAGAMMMAIFPFISKHAAAAGRGYPITALKYAVLFVLPLSLAFALIPSSLITLFFPPAYVVGTDALRIVAIGMGFLAMIQVLANIYQAQGKPWIPAIGLIAVTMVQIAGLVLLIPRWGLVGGATATTIACFLGFAYLFLLYMNMNQLKYRMTYIIKLIVSTGIPGGLLFLISPEAKLVTIASLLLGALIYIFLLAALKLVSGEDVDILKSAWPRLGFVNPVLSLVQRIIIRLNRLTG